MTKREQLIQQVISGTHAIHNNGTIEQLKEVLGWCFPDDNEPVLGQWKYYLCSGTKECWKMKDYVQIPTISVKEFYEVPICMICDYPIDSADHSQNCNDHFPKSTPKNDEFVWGEEVEVRNRHTWFNRLYVGKNPKNNLFLCVDEDGNPNEWLHIRKLPTKLKITPQMIADKFNTTVDGYEIVNGKN